MVLKIPISPEAEARLRSHAAAAGVDIETYAARWLEHFATPPLSSDELRHPSSDDGTELDMTDEELSEFIEGEIHAMRAEKRARQGR